MKIFKPALLVLFVGFILSCNSYKESIKVNNNLSAQEISAKINDWLITNNFPYKGIKNTSNKIKIHCIGEIDPLTATNGKIYSLPIYDSNTTVLIRYNLIFNINNNEYITTIKNIKYHIFYPSRYKDTTMNKPPNHYTSQMKKACNSYTPKLKQDLFSSIQEYLDK